MRLQVTCILVIVALIGSTLAGARERRRPGRGIDAARKSFANGMKKKMVNPSNLLGDIPGLRENLNRAGLRGQQTLDGLRNKYKKMNPAHLADLKQMRENGAMEFAKKQQKMSKFLHAKSAQAKAHRQN